MDLIKESEWMRIFSTGENQLRYESKFTDDRLQISLEEVKQRWNTFTPEQQLEFAIAFAAKPQWSSPDSEILDYLMSVGNEYVIQAIMNLIGEHCEKKRAVRFLLNRLDHVGPFPRANYFRVLGNIEDAEATPLLRRIYNEFVQQLSKDVWSNSAVLVDYLHCCAALRAIDGSSEFDAAIRRMQSSNDPRVQKCVQNLIK